MSEESLDSTDALQTELNEAYEFLESILLSEDLDRLPTIKRELNHHILWKKVVSDAFSFLLISLEAAVFEGGEVSKQGKTPCLQLFPVDQEFLEGKGSLRRNYVILQLLKKLLGALKTRTKQAITDIPTLDQEKEEQVREFILDAERALLLEDMDPVTLDADEEEMDFSALDGPDTAPAGFSTRGTHTKSWRSRPESQITADLSRPDSSTNCHHGSLLLSYPRVEGRLFVREFCRQCRSVVRYEPSGPDSTRSNRRRKKAPCIHRSVGWVEGKEGKEAICLDCKLSPIPNPGNYRWEEAGLEPFGDDPSEDKVESLDRLMSCES